jgi:hypothetical protein
VRTCNVIIEFAILGKLPGHCSTLATCDLPCDDLKENVFGAR